jgi:hypothetical protein
MRVMDQHGDTSGSGPGASESTAWDTRSSAVDGNVFGLSPDLSLAYGLLAVYEEKPIGILIGDLAREGLEYRLATWGHKSRGDQDNRFDPDHLAAAVSEAIAREDYR